MKLAIDGGTAVRTTPFPERHLIGDDERRLVLELLDEAISTGRMFRYGQEREREYTRLFVDYMGGGFADGVNSGTNALLCALAGLQLPALSEVIVPAITDPGGMMPIMIAGHVPIVADCDTRTFNITAAQVEPLITPRSRAIVVAHIGGEPADLSPLRELADARGLFLIEDCAQAHGAEYRGRKVGTWGHIAVFSTMSGKHHCTGGQGGVVFTTDPQLHARAKQFADRGKRIDDQPATSMSFGLNCNMDELSAAIGIAQIRKLPAIVSRCRSVGQAIRAAVRASCRAIVPAWELPDTDPSYWFLRFRVNEMSVDKTRLCAALVAEGLPIQADYATLPCEGDWFKHRWGVPAVRNARRAIEEHFVLLMRESWGERELEDVVKAFAKVETAYSAGSDH